MAEHETEMAEIPGLGLPEPVKPYKPDKPGKPAKAAKRPSKARTPAPELPIARVIVDVPLTHLDRPFDYQVPVTMHETARPGCRVRVRFSGQLVDGYLLERVERSDFTGTLLYLDRVTSPEAVLTPEVAELARVVADRYAGQLIDVIRLAVPPRHAAVEAEERAAAEATAMARPDGAGPWADYATGPEFLASLGAGRAPRAVWTAMPGPAWTDAIAVAVATALAARRGSVIVVPDGGDVARVSVALDARVGAERYVALTADLGPPERYRRWLRVLRGEVRAVVGTRAAMFAPVADLGLVVVWDDGSDVHVEPRAPYPHPREVLGLRAHRHGAAALFGGFTRTAEATQLVAGGWAHPLVPLRDVLRRSAPVIKVTGEQAELARDEAAHSARLPNLAFRTARAALADGPVLVQVPRAGYVPAIACGRCRAHARCGACTGPLALASSHAAPYCRWCGAIAGRWRCSQCEGTALRAVVVGTGRTVEELGRAFPSTQVRSSGGTDVLAAVPGRPALVVATPGAEPVADGGYAAALLLDSWAALGRADLRAGEEALRRWMNAAALVRPGGAVVVQAAAVHPVVQALVRWDPVTFAERELAERTELGFPPAVRMASLTGSAQALNAFVAAARLPEGARLLGPVDAGEGQERALVRVARARTRDLAMALKAATAARVAKKEAEIVRVQMDPQDLT